MQIEGIRSVSTSYVTAGTPISAAASEPSTPPPAIRSSQLPFISPVVQYDSDAAVAILLFRDGGSGDVEQQYPSKRIVREYQLRGRDAGGADAAGDEGSDSRSGGNPLLSLARSNFGATPTPGVSGSSSVGVSSAASASPTVVIAGGGNVGAVNFVA